MNKLVTKIILGLLLGFLLVFVGYQVFRYLYAPYRTETVYSYSVNDSITATGIMVRDEKVIPTSSSGVVVYYFEDGERVGKNATLADIYPSETDAVNRQRIDQIEEEIALLEQSQDPGSTNFTQTEYISRQISEEIYALAEMRDNGYLTDIEQIKNDLTTLLNRREIATGKVENFSARIEELQREKEALEGQLSSNISQITTDESGYFCGSIDGLESELTPEKISEMTLDELQAYIARAESGGENTSSSKLIRGYEWTFLVPIEEEDTEKFQLGVEISINFPFANMSDVPVTISHITEDPDGGAVVALTGMAMSPDLANLRCQTVQLVFKNFTGLRVNSKAVRFEGAQAGVYVVESGQITFKSIDKIYEGAGFILCREDSQMENPVELFDEVIIEGKNVYDGKSVN